MSGALYFFFFPNWAGSPVAPPPAIPPTPGSTDSGGGGRGKGKGRGKPKYEPLPPDYWDARETYLRTLYPEELPPAPPPEDLTGPSEANRLFEERRQQLEQLNADRATAIIALRTSESIQEMKAQGARITEINTKIAELMGKQAYARFMQ